ncbi:hypothetical protein [Rhizobium paknamense]|uniref:Uncharacterized protein n=1 Tax=Rhizobium paknamense TaxID=1206817 RepID=A0ABU0IG28_9HYPH|nr:hypothetical protein [Rhizobium paknamense]MDQ0457216.1 hypothetical protein [Rhizobium paknamense]
MGFAIWAIVFFGILAAAWYASRMAERNGNDTLSDMGLAIMEFNRAFPQEAIRSLHATADGRAVFVRLHDNRAGFMRNMRHHYACHLIEPGRVRVIATEARKGFRVEFADAPQHNGDYAFPTSAEAAEVSLWLLGNYVAAKDAEILPGSADAV